MASKVGKKCKVALAGSKVLGMGNWAWAGMSKEELDDSEFGDEYKTYKFGMKDAGTVAFNGYADVDDTAQNSIRTAFANDTELTDLRFYADNTSYWRPATSPSSNIVITSYEINADKSGLVQISFTGRISGFMDLV